MIDTMKEVADNFCGDPVEELREVIRNAYIAATTGDTVSRAYNVQMILEDAMSEWSDE